MHHGMQPILEKLARHQTDPNGAPFILHSPSNDLRYSLFGYPRHHFGYKVPPPLNDAQLVQKVYDAMCPNDGRHHVILESTSFPSGGKFHELRIKRQSSLWSTMSPSSIATSYSALHHPTNLYDFIETYSPLAQIQFVVLSRSFIDTVASHAQFDEGTMNHANILQGYLILLSNFLMRHRYHSLPDGMVEKVWTVVDVDKLSSKQYQDKYIMGQEHLQLVRNLTSFLNWKDSECDDCFHHWVESNMESEKVLGKRNVERLMEMVGELEGIWPPREEDYYYKMSRWFLLE